MRRSTGGVRTSEGDVADMLGGGMGRAPSEIALMASTLIQRTQGGISNQSYIYSPIPLLSGEMDDEVLGNGSRDGEEHLP